MKRLSPIVVKTVFAAIVLLVVLLARRDLNEPHFRLFADMVQSPAYRSQTASPPFWGGQTLRAPAAGTIPRGYFPFHYGDGQSERSRAGRELKNPSERSLGTLERGREVYDIFCSHCHGRQGLGDGAVSKAYPGVSYSLAGKSAFDIPDGEIFHIITRGRNNMPPHDTQIVENDRWKLVLYLRDLQEREKARQGPFWAAPEDPRRHRLVAADYGKELFAENCASCHGAEGRKPQSGAPTLNSRPVLGIAADAFYWEIISHGRKGTQMPAWKDILTPTQIKSLVMYFRTWERGPHDLGQILAARGDASRGAAVFKANCSGCHGKGGEGGIGNSLRSPSFLAMASEEFLRATIASGRSHTAMPSGYDLGEQDVSDLLALIGSWRHPRQTFSEVGPMVAAADPAAGGRVYAGRCASCHGEKGDGGVGPRLRSDKFLAMADDEFLYRSIVEGRPGTAMPAWWFLGKEDVSALIAFMRQWQTSKPEMLSKDPISGRPEFGKLLYEKNCRSCHGEDGAGGEAPQIGNRGFLAHVSDQFLWRSIAYGKSKTKMRGFLDRAENPLSGEDLNHLVAYLRSLADAPTTVVRMRRMGWADAESGREVYDRTCSACHGRNGEGGSGPAIGNPAFLRSASDGFMVGTAILGREGTTMPGYGAGDVRLGSEDIENAVAYVRSLGETAAKASRRVPSSPEIVADGRALYRNNCARCHGANGLGVNDSPVKGTAPSLKNKAHDGILWVGNSV